LMRSRRRVGTQFKRAVWTRKDSSIDLGLVYLFLHHIQWQRHLGRTLSSQDTH
jgi:hypothetical protein